MKKVIITKLPKYKQGGAFRTFGPQTPPQDNTVTPGKGFSDNRSTPEIKVNRTLKPVPQEEANLEAEKGETVVTSLNDDGIPEFYNISGKRHSKGGTPLNLPEHSFIFSRSKDLLVKNPDIQRYFGMSEKKSGYTPADISKKFNLNKYREILADPTMDKMQRETAELMIKNYVGKLGALALAQEAAKGFQEGIPSIAGPFMDKMGIDPNAIAGQQEQQQQPMQMSKYGGRTLRKALWGLNLDEDEIQGDFEQKSMDDYGIGTEIKSKQRVFGKGDWLGTDSYLPSAVALGTTLGNLINPAVTPQEAERRTWGTEQAMVFGSNRGMGADKQTGNFWDPTRTTPIQFGLDTSVDPNTGNVFTKYGGSMPRTLRRFEGGGAVGEKDVKLKKGDKIIHIPGTGYAIVDKRGNFKGYVDAEENELSGTNADPNNSRVEPSSKPTRSANIPKGAVKWDPSKEGFDQSKVKVGHYMKRPDGRWYKVTGHKVSPYEGRKLETLDDRLGQYKEAYGRLEHKIISSPDLQKALVKQYRDLIDQVKPKGRMTSADIARAKEMSDEEIINNYLRAEKQVMMINSSDPGIGQRDDKDTWDRGWDNQAGVPREYAKKTKELGISPLSSPQTIAFQTAYIGMQNLYDSGEYKEQLQDFKPLSKTQVGYDDEGKGLAKGHATISDVDGWWGNTTTGQAQLYTPLKQELDYEAVDEVVDEGYEHLPDTPHGSDLAVGPYPEDRRNLNYATWATFARRKGQPALVQPTYYESQPQFTDFFGPVSRMSGQALNLATENPYLTGQRYGSVASSLVPVEGIIQAQEQANRFNVATENQFRQANAAARNQHSALRAGNLKRYLDEVEMANEMANRELIGGVGLMNAARNQLTKNWRNINLTNEMSDDFAIDPNDVLNPVKKKYNPVPITPKDQYDQLEAVAEGAKILRSYQPGLSEDKAMELATKLITGQDVGNSGWNQMPGMNAPYIDPAAYGLNT